MRLTLHLTAALTAVLLAAACSEGLRLGGKSGRDDAPTAKPKEEERPSDAGEGLEGYLTDPAGLVVTRQGDTLTVAAPAGAVAAAADAGTLAELKVVAVKLDAGELAGACAAAEASASVRGEAIGSTSVAADGSFSLATTGQGTAVVALIVTRNETASDVPLAADAPGRARVATIRPSALAALAGACAADYGEPPLKAPLQRIGVPTEAKVMADLARISGQGKAAVETLIVGQEILEDLRPWIGHSDCVSCPTGTPTRQRIRFEAADASRTYRIVIHPAFVTKDAGALFARVVEGSARIVRGAAHTFAHVGFTGGAGVAPWIVDFVPASPPAPVVVELGNEATAGAAYVYMDFLEVSPP